MYKYRYAYTLISLVMVKQIARKTVFKYPDQAELPL